MAAKQVDGDAQPRAEAAEMRGHHHVFEDPAPLVHQQHPHRILYISPFKLLPESFLCCQQRRAILQRVHSIFSGRQQPDDPQVGSLLYHANQKQPDVIDMITQGMKASESATGSSRKGCFVRGLDEGTGGAPGQCHSRAGGL